MLQLQKTTSLPEKLLNWNIRPGGVLWLGHESTSKGTKSHATLRDYFQENLTGRVFTVNRQDLYRARYGNRGQKSASAGIFNPRTWIDSETFEIIEIEQAEERIKARPDLDPETVKIILKSLGERKVRIGQVKFRKRLEGEDGLCIFTNDDVNEAAHLNLPGEPLSKQGVLLRVDISRRFDYKKKDLLQPINGGKQIVLNSPGHELHGRIARLSEEKALLVSAELNSLRGIEIK